MITMNIKQQILMMHIHEGKSRREIAKITGINRDTVGKYIGQYEEGRQQLLTGESADIQALVDSLTSAPKYTVGIRPKRKLTDEVVKRIQFYLDENETKRNQGQRKQQKKAIDIFEALEAEGVQLSYSTVLRTIHSLERKPKEAFIKALYEPGDICEFDWGEVKLKINGRLQIFQMAVFTMAYGNYRFACLFTKQTTECFQEAHTLFFQHIGQVYRTMVYDYAAEMIIGDVTEKPHDNEPHILKRGIIFNPKYTIVFGH
ncbi:helix-turn-helix domain-containing protein [Dehalobacterium formicoaceticum]|uniref:Helix-turn-helix domain-containing protein n=1 Tax=Dehalobacterium formicoaceticum TaxID=51515 RepID=A0ABT1Y830_9FIRM|nr:helix-turn-helix domain-containing protein [Dehalobacterium formicoaceticum]MCR6547023.1 helix-turn-helix domain-containing protein [Dehalobacterium formicoaceticum]